MSFKFNIALDAMGGENAPFKVVEGLSLFLKDNKSDVSFTLFGKSKEVFKVLKDFNIKDDKRVSVVNCENVISNELSVRDSIKLGKDTSMWKSIESVKENKCEIIISSGNTGALLVISKLILKTLNGIDKPALAALWPNKKNLSVVLDLGANIDCSEKNFIQFSKIGSQLFSVLFSVTKPKVGLLNIGSEEIKGNETLKSTNSKLTKKIFTFNYIGYVEGSDITKGIVDVVVTDGFTGNIALKTAEGTANYITSEIRNEFSKSLFSKLSYIASLYVFRRIKKRLDPRNYNGAIFLGLSAPVIKSHGGADGYAFYNSIKLSYKILNGNLMQKIKSNISYGEK